MGDKKQTAMKSAWKKTSSATANDNKPYTVTIFCASSMGTNPGFAEDARNVGIALAKNKWRLVYGGGDFGLMGIVSQAALNQGGEIKGILPPLFDQASDYPQKQFETHSADIFERKKMMLEEADAYIVLAGGFGTLDELAEAGCEQYLASYKTPPEPAKPIIIINRGGLYDSYITQLKAMVGAGLAHEKIMDMFTFVKDGKEAIKALKALKSGKPHYLPCIGNVDHRRFDR